MNLREKIEALKPHHNNHAGYSCGYKDAIADVLALLGEACQTCGGSGTIEKTPVIAAWSEHGDREQESCPDCDGPTVACLKRSDVLAAIGEGEDGVSLIAAERARQVEQEGWTPEHDDEHRNDEMALAAACYATPILLYQRDDYANQVHYVDPWPWEHRWDKRPSNGNVILPNDSLSCELRIRQLAKAGALIAAEIDRLQRLHALHALHARGEA